MKYDSRNKPYCLHQQQTCYRNCVFKFNDIPQANIDHFIKSRFNRVNKCIRNKGLIIQIDLNKWKYLVLKNHLFIVQKHIHCNLFLLKFIHYYFMSHNDGVTRAVVMLLKPKYHRSKLLVFTTVKMIFSNKNVPREKTSLNVFNRQYRLCKNSKCEI